MDRSKVNPKSKIQGDAVNGLDDTHVYGYCGAVVRPYAAS